MTTPATRPARPARASGSCRISRHRAGRPCGNSRLADGGIVCLAAYMTSADVASARLRTVMDSALLDVRQPISAVFYQSASMAGRAKAFSIFSPPGWCFEPRGRILPTPAYLIIEAHHAHSTDQRARPACSRRPLQPRDARGQPDLRSGQLPMRPDGTHTGDLPFDEQALQTLANLSTVLAATGADCRTDRSDGLSRRRRYWKEFNEIYARHFGDWKPARAVVPVGALHYGYLLEIRRGPGWKRCEFCWLAAESASPMSGAGVRMSRRKT